MAEEQLKATFGHRALAAMMDESGNAMRSLGSGKVSQLCQLTLQHRRHRPVDSFLVIL